MENTKSDKGNHLSNLEDNLVSFLKEKNNLIKGDFNSLYINISVNQRNEDILRTKGKVGIYIFKDSSGRIKYIGKGGTSRKSTGTDLLFRIRQELSIGHNYSTLSRNIIEKEKVNESQSKTIIDDLSLSAIIIGDKSADSRNEILNTEALENFLIAIYDPEYNK
jgi:hypothetical protein